MHFMVAMAWCLCHVQMPKVAETCNFSAIMDGYYKVLFPLNPGSICPVMPSGCEHDVLLSTPHNRESLSLANKTTKQDHWVYERIGDKIAKGGKANYQTGLLKISEGNWRTAKRPLKEIDVWWCDQLWFLPDARYKIFVMESTGWFAKM
jgi:hypothetical protein